MTAQKDWHRAIGVISGTSTDATDVARKLTIRRYSTELRKALIICTASSGGLVVTHALTEARAAAA